LCRDARLHKPLLGALEKFLEERKSSKLMQQIPSLLTGLFEFEIIPEETLLEYLKTPKTKYVSPDFHAEFLKLSKPFVEWLEAEEEEEEDEEEEEEEELAPAKATSTPASDDEAPKPASTGVVSKFKMDLADSDSDSDVDLDDL
jgi:CO dehydrogenase/acetyl-CoA synthase beta subunit